MFEYTSTVYCIHVHVLLFYTRTSLQSICLIKYHHQLWTASAEFNYCAYESWAGRTGRARERRSCSSTQWSSSSMPRRRRQSRNRCRFLAGVLSSSANRPERHGEDGRVVLLLALVVESSASGERGQNALLCLCCLSHEHFAGALSQLHETRLLPPLTPESAPQMRVLLHSATHMSYLYSSLAESAKCSGRQYWTWQRCT